MLAEPGRDGFNATLWIVPIVLVLLAAVGIGVRHPALARQRDADAPSRELPPPLSAEDARRLDAELSR